MRITMSLSAFLLHVALLAVCCAGRSPGDVRVPAPGLAGNWRFERGPAPNAQNVAHDYSPHGLHATLRPGAVIDSAGKLRGALVLNGKGGSAECPDAVALNPPRQLTLMTWFRLEKGTLNLQKILVGKGAARHAAPYYQYAITAMDRDDVSARLTFHAAVNGTLQSCSAQDLPLDFYTGWHHVAGTFDGKTLRLYLNGREAAIPKTAGTLSTFPTPLVMGAYGNLPRNATYGLAGALDDVAIYSRALSADEIGSYYWRAQRDLLLSRPGNGKTFGSVADDHVAAQSFTALGPALESAAIWLADANDDELLVQVRENDIKGRILATASLSAGPVGKRLIRFARPVAMQTKHTYVLKVGAGAPGTTRGAVEQQEPGDSAKGLTETGPSDHAMAIELRFLPSGLRRATRNQRIRRKSEADIRYETVLNAALNAKRDVWGEKLIARDEGPTYENIVDYLRPMMWIGDYVTTSGVYYLVFGQHDSVTGGGDAALHVADGSEIISRNHKTGRRTTFFVGSNGNERYGTDLHRLDGPRLHQGYQPVLLTKYQDNDGGRWEQESFATHIPETDSLVSFVRITRLADPAGGKPATLRVRTTLTDAVVQGNQLVSGGSTVLAFQPGAVFASPFLTYTFPNSSHTSTVFLIRLNQPAACKKLIPDARRFATQRDAVCRFWDKHLRRGAVFAVPEKRVMDAMRNLLIQNLFMTWRYSIGNAYETWFPQESGDALKMLGEFGFLDEYRENLQVLLPRTFRGEDERMEEYAHKLFYTAHCARLTADYTWLAANRPLVKRWIEGMRKVMANDPQGLLGKTRAGDIHTHRYYSNH